MKQLESLLNNALIGLLVSKEITVDAAIGIKSVTKHGKSYIVTFERSDINGEEALEYSAALNCCNEEGSIDSAGTAFIIVHELDAALDAFLDTML